MTCEPLDVVAVPFPFTDRPEWRKAGLRVPCKVRLKLFTLDIPHGLAVPLRQPAEFAENQGAGALAVARLNGHARPRPRPRALLCRLAARKFDAAAGRRLAAALADVADAERLAEVGDWIIECGTAAELLARVARSGS